MHLLQALEYAALVVLAVGYTIFLRRSKAAEKGGLQAAADGTAVTGGVKWEAGGADGSNHAAWSIRKVGGQLACGAGAGLGGTGGGRGRECLWSGRALRLRGYRVGRASSF